MQNYLTRVQISAVYPAALYKCSCERSFYFEHAQSGLTVAAFAGQLTVICLANY